MGMTSFLYSGDPPKDVIRLRVDSGVRSIREYSFSNCEDLVEAHLPHGLEVIGDRAFGNCRELKTLPFPSTITEIRDGAFDECRKLVLVGLENTRIKSIGPAAFSRCESITTVRLPSTLESIEDEAFISCTNLALVILCNGLLYIGPGAFVDCSSLCKIEIPPSVTEIGCFAFQGTRLRYLVLSQGLKTISTKAFAKCFHLRSVKIPSSVTTIESFAFQKCEDLTSVEIAEGIQSIQFGAFDGCPSICNMFIPDSCSADKGLFDECNLIQDAFQLESSKAVDENAFSFLRRRFDDLPVHKLCYYQSFHKPSLDEWKTAIDDEKAEKRQDIMGMTPLHILALSKTPDVGLFQELLQRYPNDLVTKDSGGLLPLQYMSMVDTPIEVAELLQGKEHVGLLAELHLDWDAVFRCTIQNCSTQLLRVMIRLSISMRFSTLGLDRWKEDILDSIKAISSDGSKETIEIMDEIDKIRGKLTKYERKEIISLLQLAIRKSYIEGWQSNKQDVDGRHKQKRPKMEDPPPVAGKREQLNCKYDAIVANVLPFLWAIPNTNKNLNSL